MPMLDVFGYNIVSTDSTKEGVESAIQGTERLEAATKKTGRQMATEFRDIGRVSMVMGVSLISLVGVMDSMGVSTGQMGPVLTSAGQAMASLGGAVSMASVVFKLFGDSVSAAMGPIGIAVIVIGTLIAAYKALEQAKKKTIDTDKEFTDQTRALNYWLTTAQHSLDGYKREYNELKDAMDDVIDATRTIKNLTQEQQDIGWTTRELSMSREETEQRINKLAMEKLGIDTELQSGTYMTLTALDDAKAKQQEITHELERQTIQLEKIKDQQGDMATRKTEIAGEVATATEKKGAAQAAMTKLGYPTLEQAKTHLKELEEGPIKVYTEKVIENEGKIFTAKINNELAWFSTTMVNEGTRHATVMANLEEENLKRQQSGPMGSGTAEPSAGESTNTPEDLAGSVNRTGG